MEDTTITHKAVGTVVEYVDEFGQPHDALVTRVFSSPSKEASLTLESLNVVYVAPDESQVDQYGRQLARATSVVPEQNQSAHGRFYRVK